jgi:hypothetical protein
MTPLTVGCYIKMLGYEATAKANLAIQNITGAAFTLRGYNTKQQSRNIMQFFISARKI